MKVGDCVIVLNILFLELEDHVKESGREGSVVGSGEQWSWK